MTPLTNDENDLIRSGLGMMREVARFLAGRFPGVSFDDFCGAGHRALTQAAKRFDRSRRVPFDGYAYCRVRGEMLDEAARILKTPLRELRRLADVDERAETGEVEDEPSMDDLMAEAVVDPRTRAIEALAAKAAMMAAAALMDAAPAPSAEEEILEAETRAHGLKTLHEVLELLPEQERVCVRAVFFDGMTVVDTAARLDLASRTVHRSLERAKERLKKALRQRGVDATL